MEHRPFSFIHLPKAIKALMLMTASVFIAQWILPEWIIPLGALIPNKTIFSFQIWRIFTYIFLHGSFFHLFFNMFVLWSFGKELEYLWGTKEFVKYFFLCGIGAALFNLLLEPNSNASIIGSSGAIYGILLAFAINFPDTIVYLYGLIPVRTKHFVIFLCAIEFLSTFQGQSPIARFAHLGGMVTGFAYLRFFSFRSMIDGFVSTLTPSIPNPKPARKKEERKLENIDSEVDKILDKVLEKGPGSLSESEREVMRRYSLKKRDEK